MVRYDRRILKEARLKKRWTQTELARRTGLSVATISYIENGKCNDGRGIWLKAIREMELVLGIRNAIKTGRNSN